MKKAMITPRKQLCSRADLRRSGFSSPLSWAMMPTVPIRRKPIPQYRKLKITEATATAPIYAGVSRCPTTAVSTIPCRAIVKLDRINGPAMCNNWVLRTSINDRIDRMSKDYGSCGPAFFADHVDFSGSVPLSRACQKSFCRLGIIRNQLPRSSTTPFSEKKVFADRITLPRCKFPRLMLFRHGLPRQLIADGDHGHWAYGRPVCQKPGWI